MKKLNMKKQENLMRQMNIEKVIISIGGKAEQLEKGARLLSLITGRKANVVKSRKRIQSLGVRPGLEVGCFITLRGRKALVLLKRLLEAINNTIKLRQIKTNHFSFGIKEYIEIPGVEYQRDIGLFGMDVSVVFARKGKRVVRRKIKRGKLPRRQHVSVEEIVSFMKKNFKIEVE